MALTLETFQDPAALLEASLPLISNIVAALAIFFIGKWVASAVIALVKRGMERGKMDATLANFLGNVLYGLALAVIIISALGQLGVDTTSAAALLGGAAIAIGLSLQGQIASFAAGVMLIIFRPFRVGDYVEVAGTNGTVKDLKIIATVLHSLDNQEITIPNASVWGDTITNYSTLPTRRVDITMGIAYGADLRRAKQLLEQILAEESRILTDPEPSVVVKNLGDSSVDFAVRGFTNTADWWATYCALLEAIKLRFDEEGIEIPFPQMDLHVRDMPKAA